MALFKKSGMQGNFILSNGVQVLFDVDGYHETSDENVISQLKSVYEQVEKRAEKVDQKSAAKPQAAVAKTGAVSSASLAAVSKANS